MEKQHPLISVIVPIYNVEQYLRKCLESLKEQSLKQIEVICIDDGSMDGSEKIADEYANEDERFRVIHTENRGLSAARNRGIEEARADWLMFVDSDDWVHEDFCRVPYVAAINNQADMVIFDHYTTSQQGRLRRTHTNRIQSGFVTEKGVIRNNCVWNKLYKSKLFFNLRYPESHVYEDIATTHKIVHRTERIYHCEERLYYYRKRKGSISRSVSSRSDEYSAIIQRYNDLVEWGYIIKEDQYFIQEASLDYCGHAESTDEKLYQIAIDIVDNIVDIPDGFDLKHRMKLLLWRINRNVYRDIYHVCGRQMKQV